MYIRCLKKIVDGFKRPLLASNALTEEDADTVFSNVQELLALHEAFLPDLSKATATGTVLMSSPFLQHVKEMLLHYGRFSCDYNQAVNKLELLEKGPIGTEIESMRQRTGGQKFSLKKLLSVPAMHLRGYSTFLDSLLKALPNYHADELQLVRAKTAMDNLVVHVNSKREDQQEILATAARLEGYDGPPLQSFAPLIRAGELMYVDLSNGAGVSKGSSKGSSKSYVILLQKAIVITTALCDCADASQCQHKCAFRGLCMINPAWSVAQNVTPTFPTKTHRFAFVIKENGRVMHEFAVQSLPAKRKWKVALQKCLTARRSSSKGTSTNRAGTGPKGGDKAAAQSRLSTGGAGASTLPRKSSKPDKSKPKAKPTLDVAVPMPLDMKLAGDAGLGCYIYHIFMNGNADETGKPVPPLLYVLFHAPRHLPPPHMYTPSSCAQPIRTVFWVCGMAHAHVTYCC